MTDTHSDTIGQQGQQCPHLALDTRQFADNFYETLDECRAASPLAWDDTHDWWVITRAETLSDVLRDWQSFTSADGVGGPHTPILLPMDSDPPVHTQWRTPLNGFFTKRVMDAQSDNIAKIAHRLIDPLRAGTEADFQQAFTSQLPGLVFFELILGLSGEQLKHCAHLVETGMDFTHPEQQAAGFQGLFAFATDLVTQRRGQPSDGSLIDTVVHAQLDGQQASTEDAVSVLVMLILGGLETTSNTLGNVLLHLGRDQALQARLREDPALLPTAVEEFLRMYAPTIYLIRRATRDVDIQGLTVQEGQTVALSYAAAGRDPEQHQEPAAFRLDREHYRHQTFGMGIHRCIGSNLARVMLRVALEVVLAEVQEWRPADGFQPVYRVGSVRALERLPLTYRMRA